MNKMIKKLAEKKEKYLSDWSKIYEENVEIEQPNDQSMVVDWGELVCGCYSTIPRERERDREKGKLRLKRRKKGA